MSLCTLNKDILVSQLPRFKDPVKSEYVCKLKKPIYDEKGFLEIHDVLEKLGFKKLQFTNCVYTLNFYVVLLLYVDNIIIYWKNEKNIKEVINLLETKFDVKILEETRKLLKVKFEEEGENLYIHHLNYIVLICERYKKNNFPINILP